ncbi:MAG TPA: hypothetical protein VK590_10740 [Saprospiraceae bacterium]|nr:hypothetical protein [Saprospiraceae bacterium]
MVKKLNLKDIIEKVQWLNLTAKSSSSSLSDNAVSVSFSSKLGKPGAGIYVYIKFGKEVVEKMKWKVGDKIVVMNDPDDFMSFLLVKCETGAGRVLGIDGTKNISTTHRIVFKWNRPIPISPRGQKVVEHEIYQKHIYFRVNDGESK